jgi:hypothetical protein
MKINAEQLARVARKMGWVDYVGPDNGLGYYDELMKCCDGQECCCHGEWYAGEESTCMCYDNIITDKGIAAIKAKLREDRWRYGMAWDEKNHLFTITRTVFNADTGYTYPTYANEHPDEGKALVLAVLAMIGGSK